MVPATILTVICTMSVSPLRAWAFRQARPADARWNLLKTLGQVVVFWSILLFVAPCLITVIEGRLGLERFSFAYQRPLATFFFVTFGIVGLWSGLVMAHFGQGTPLPLDSPRRLVVRGPYAFVRNPMAIASFGPGFAVALWWGSLLVFAYVMAGVWTWQYLARPLEEENMRGLFGQDFEQYSSEVPCWWPRRAPYIEKALTHNDGFLQNSIDCAGSPPMGDEHSGP
jgi:protein-S-isoprenylcysteine O-methyltransferase Ste14